MKVQLILSKVCNGRFSSKYFIGGSKMSSCHMFVSNPGPLGEKHKRFLYAMLYPTETSANKGLWGFGLFMCAWSINLGFCAILGIIEQSLHH